MSVPAAKKSFAPLNDSQRSALLKLLGDDDEAVFLAVREQILSTGHEALDWLRPCLVSPDPILRRHAREIVTHISQHDADTEFLVFCLQQGEEFDLEEALWIFCRTRYPEINAEAYTALLDGYAAELRSRLLDAADAPEHVLAVCNEYLFSELGFRGNEENYYDPQNSYLNRVLDRRTGNPISLCLVYLLVLRRLHLPVAGIGMPGHFLCRFQNAQTRLYLDAFNRGKILTKADCVRYLLETQHDFNDGQLAPVSPRRILMRICANLHQIYTQLEAGEEVERFQRYLVALAK